MPTYDHTNPDTVSPASQSFPAAGVTPAPPPGSAAVDCSTGECQVPARPKDRAVALHRGLPADSRPAEHQLPAAVDAAAASSRPVGLPTESRPADHQTRSAVTTQAAPTTCRGLPAEVRAGDASQAKKIPVTRGAPLAPTANVIAGGERPGRGLPANVHVR
jgi:hypothetical protein